MNDSLKHGKSATSSETDESRQSLWRLTVGPVIWALHFLACYITAAIWCEKYAGRDGPLGSVRVAIAVLTIVALAGIAWAARDGWRRHSFGASTLPHDFDTPEDRHRFLGFSAFLLAALSGVATIFTALVAIFMSDCR
jgi:hypothetical protein